MARSVPMPSVGNKELSARSIGLLCRKSSPIPAHFMHELQFFNPEYPTFSFSLHICVRISSTNTFLQALSIIEHDDEPEFGIRPGLPRRANARFRLTSGGGKSRECM